MHINTKEGAIEYIVMGRGKKERLLVSREDKQKLLKMIENKDMNKATQKLFSNSKFYVDGHKSKPNMDFINEYIVCKEDISFTNEIIRKYKSMLENTDKELRLPLLKVIMSNIFNANPSKELLKSILKRSGVEYSTRTKVLSDAEVSKIADVIGTTREIVYKTLYVAFAENVSAKGFSSKAIKNFANNMNKVFEKSKNKKLKKINPKVYADPNLSEVNIYNSKLRPDIVIEVNEDNDKNYIVGELFDWKNSEEYKQRQLRKINYVIENGIPFFMIASSKDSLHNDIFEKKIAEDYKDTTYLLYSVAKWTENNLYIPDKHETILDALYLNVIYMMDYAGLNKYIPSSVIECFQA